MLITDRRLRATFIALAGMEAAVLSAYLLLLFRYEWLWREDSILLSWSPLRLLLALWVGLLAMTTVVDLLGHSRLSDAGYRMAVVGTVMATTLVAVRLLIYGERAPFDLSWIGEAAAVTLNFHRGVHPASFMLVLVIFLWLRASAMTGREINFLGVGFHFRLGLLLLLAGAGFLVIVEPERTAAAMLLFLVYMAAGLLAVALARSDEKSAAMAGSSGDALSMSRLGQLLIMVGLIVGLTFTITMAYSPEEMRATLAFFNPLWRLLERFAALLLTVFVLVLERLVTWLYALLAPLLARLQLNELLSEMAANLAVDEQETTVLEQSDPGPFGELILTLIRGLFIAGAITLVLALIYLFLVRRRRRPDSGDAETTAMASPDLSGDRLRQGWERLKRWADLVRHYGLGMRLLDAITVENIYANLSRLARQRGYPRRSAQPPDEYLPALQRAFPGHDEALARITTAYMQVHYGDTAIQGDALWALRADYEAVRSENESR